MAGSEITTGQTAAPQNTNSRKAKTIIFHNNKLEVATLPTLVASPYYCIMGNAHETDNNLIITNDRLSRQFPLHQNSDFLLHH